MSNKEKYQDIAVVGLDLPIGLKTLDVSKVFKDGDVVHDAYSNRDISVKNGTVLIDSDYDIVLLEIK